jgi:hypothetical protein
MTKAAWLQSTDPQKMLESLGKKATERKLPLFACACCRRIWDLLPECVMVSGEDHEGCRQAVVRAEGYADGQATANELIDFSDGPLWTYSAPAAFMAAASRLLDVFASAGKDSAWRASSIALLARAAYDQRILPACILDNLRLGVLADALEESGCAEADLVEHLRSPGPHVRGCWALDLLLANK